MLFSCIKTVVQLLNVTSAVTAINHILEKLGKVAPTRKVWQCQERDSIKGQEGSLNCDIDRKSLGRACLLVIESVFVNFALIYDSIKTRPI